MSKRRIAGILIRPHHGEYDAQEVFKAFLTVAKKLEAAGTIVQFQFGPDAGGRKKIIINFGPDGKTVGELRQSYIAKIMRSKIKPIPEKFRRAIQNNPASLIIKTKNIK